MLRSHRIPDIGPEMTGEKVTIAGNIDEIRDLGGIKFLLIRDGSDELQVTSKEDRNADIFAQLKDLTRESCIQVKGEVKATDQAPGGRELAPIEVTVLSEAHTPLPLDPSEEVDAARDTRLNWRSLDLRRKKSQAIFRIQDALIDGMVDHLQKKDFTRIFTPSILGVASEGGSEIFPVPYYGDEAFLRQDPQLHRELTIGGNFDGVFEIGPSWRAEESHTSRHLTEHRTISVERAYIEDESDVIDLQEELVISALENIKNTCEKHLDTLDVDIKIPERPFPVLQFPEIYDILEDHGKDIEYGTEPDREGEQILADYVKEERGHDFYFLNKFPFEEKGIFYAMKDEDPEWARSVDLVFRGTEISTGGQREHRYDQIIKQVDELGMQRSDVEWYTKFLKYGMPPHGGFSIGIERIIMSFLKLENIREAALFPRAPERLIP